MSLTDPPPCIQYPMAKDAKNAGESVTPVTHPDPKVWKWCKHPECKKLQPTVVNEREQEVMRKQAVRCAVFGEDYCWKHLPDEAKIRYSTKIERLKQYFSLGGANFFKGKFPEEMNLSQAKLQGAYLHKSKLRKVHLDGANLYDANLTWSDLQGAYFNYANLQKANLARAKLQGADFREAKLHGAFLNNVELEGAKGLTWDQFKKQEHGKWVGKARVGEENKRNWHGACGAYRRLKNYFHIKGQYEDEIKAYYREKLMAKKQAFAEKKRWRGFILALSQALTGFGEHWWKTALWALGIVALFSVIYGIGHATGVFLFDFKPAMIPSVFQYFYLSVVTFATLGFGDITPLCWQAQIPVVVEVIFGYVFLGLIITIIARRFGR